MNNNSFSLHEKLPYAVGALMYTPATNENIAKHILKQDFSNLSSLVFCLEDSIRDEIVPMAEKRLIETFKEIHQGQVATENLPLLFIRIRNATQLIRIYEMLGELAQYLTGFVLPKFDLSNEKEYFSALKQVNIGSSKTVYAMPTLESASIIQLQTRHELLFKLKERFIQHKDLILNIRVGGNDFCNLYSIRRGLNQTIYDIGVLNSVLTDILNVFSYDFVVSAPVWEYFKGDSDDWLVGLKKEIALDLLNGFVGKTAIHPSQLDTINNALKVKKSDYMDAKNILGWSDKVLGVAKSANGMRMNEFKVHGNWAKKTMILAEVYGVLED